MGRGMGASPGPAAVIGAPRAGPRAWLASLQSLRGLAALAVVLYHVDVDFRNHGLPLLPIPGLRFGWLGVDLFFVLSGFLLGRPFIDGRAQGRSLREFWQDRFLRIAPAYYAAWATTAVFLVVLVPGVWQVASSLWSLVFLNNLHYAGVFALNPAFWTLAVEMQFYVVLPWMARAFTGPRWGWALAAFLAVSLAFRAATFEVGGEEANIVGTYSLPAFLGHFALGLAACRVRRLARPGLAALAAVPLIVLPPALLVPADSLSFGYESLAGQVFLRPLMAVGFALLILAGATPGWFERSLGWAPLRGLGAISYSLYLVHILAILAVDRFLGLGDRWLFLLACVAASLAAGTAFYAAVEAPAERWRHRRKLRQRTSAAARTPPAAG
jgi:peptidoglycan/LPS O-acetylase OafA/YrhL